jgi:alanine dehydrogenase
MGCVFSTPHTIPVLFETPPISSVESLTDRSSNLPSPVLSNLVASSESSEHGDEHLRKESESNQNITYVFQDIIDDKHMKYMSRYENDDETIFWGIGLENESYFMLRHKLLVSSFRSLKQKSERYSVDYFTNFKLVPFLQAIQKAQQLEHLTYPVYINSHTFQKTDVNQQHRTFYDKHSTLNPKFTESIHDRLLRESDYYRSVYDESVVFDGDSIEFITQRFYNGTVSDCVAELKESKQRFVKEISPYFHKWGLGEIEFPDHNYGFVTFLTTRKANLSICNSGTLHLNITLPTRLRNGMIVDKDMFAKTHLNFIQVVQMVEPLLVACYGTPDILALLNHEYSLGSLRISRSRYISLQTFNTHQPVNGKLLLMDKPSDPLFWYNQLESSPYFLNNMIGYDVNFNKFKNHGVEIRFFDWFPEEYVEDVMNLFILLAAHSLYHGDMPIHKPDYTNIILSCVKHGFTTRLTMDEVHIILRDLHLEHLKSVLFTMDMHITPIILLQQIATELYEQYQTSDVVQKMSPHMTCPVLVDYNCIAFRELYRDLYGRPELIIRSELNRLEARTPIVPSDIPSLLQWFTVKVESSAVRCYSDSEYESVGAMIVPRKEWISSRNSYVIGLKAIDHPAHSSQTLMHFAHCFKGQEGSHHTMELLRDCRFIDYEYMVDTSHKRVISFCAQSGKIGCYLALMAYHQRDQKVIIPFHEGNYRTILYNMEKKPRVLLIGYGTAGKAAKVVMDELNITCTIWTRQHVPDKTVILDHDVLIHAIRLSDDTTNHVPPFLVPDDLNGQHRLSVICDITCDMGNPRNTLPLYTEYTTALHPVVPLTDSIDLIAINNLPSLEPMVSSDQFSAILVHYLPELLWMNTTKEIHPKAKSMYDSYQVFENIKKMGKREIRL